MDQEQKRRKLLSKYIGAIPSKRKINNGYNEQNVWMKDDEDIIEQSSQQSSQEQIDNVKRERIQSSDEGEDNQDNKKKLKQKLKQKLKKKQQKALNKQRKLKKKIRNALGLQKDQQIDQFLNNLQVEGIQKEEIINYLKNNKSAIIKKQPTQQKQSKKKKKKQKKQEKQSSNKKFQMFEKSQSSDLQIPQQARAKTIYRNKDGTIRQNSQKQQKQKHKQAVMERLAEWEKGMKKQQSDHQVQEHEDLEHAKSNKIWNDPMKRWEQKLPTKLLTCKFQGPPNRYNIKPGFRWDGVIRGNGFQNRYLQEINLKKAKKDKQHMDYMKDL